MMMEKLIAKELLKIGAVFLSPEKPFIWASGIKSPIYCDNRLILSAPKTRDLVEQALADTVRTRFPETEMLMGTSTAGIAHAALAAHLLGLPMGYVRGAAKDHGRSSRIEGKLSPGCRTVVIEDLISTGGSAVDTVEALRAAGAEVLGAVSIFTYGMASGRERLSAAQVVCHSLCSLDTLVETAVEEGYLAPVWKVRILQFRDAPADESWIPELNENTNIES